MSYPKIEAYMAAGRPKDAERAIREELAQNMENPRLFTLLARVLLDLDKTLEAEKAIQKSIQLDSDIDANFYYLAAIQLARCQYRKALESAEKAIARNPREAENHGMKAWIHHKLSENNLALESLAVGLAIDPVNAHCRLFKTIVLNELGQHDEAEAEILKLLEESPEDHDYHFVLGQIQFGKGESGSARIHFNEALRLSPENSEFRSRLATAISLDQPVVGRFLRLLLWERITIPQLLLGVFAVLFIVTLLAAMPEPWPLIARYFLAGFLTFAILVLVSESLFSLTLFLSRENRKVLTSAEQRAVRYFFLPLAIGLFILVFWLFRGANALPYLALPWLAAAFLISKTFNEKAPSVRRWILPGVGIALGLWVLYATYGILAPRVTEYQSLKEAHEKETFSHEFWLLRRHLLVWPCLVYCTVAWFFGSVRIRSAPD